MLQCTQNVTDLGLGRYDLAWLSLCDPWALPHLLTPFWLTVFFKSFLVGWFGAHLGETLELLLQTIFGSFVLFAEANSEAETQGQILEDILQGFIGSMLAVVFSWVFSDAPALLQLEDVYPSRVKQGRLKRFIFYLFFLFLGTMAPPFIMALKLDNGFPLGTSLYTPIFLASFGIILYFQSAFLTQEEMRQWKSYQEFWWTGILFTVIISIQHNWNYLYSSTVQTWVFSFAFFLYLLARKI